jgi:hypothetical protein
MKHMLVFCLFCVIFSFVPAAFSAAQDAQEGNATWHDTDSLSLTAAHARLPLGTRLRVTNLENGKEVYVTINNRIPSRPDRILDLSSEAARLLEMFDNGTTPVRIEVMRGLPPDPFPPEPAPAAPAAPVQIAEVPPEDKKEPPPEEPLAEIPAEPEPPAVAAAPEAEEEELEAEIEPANEPPVVAVTPPPAPPPEPVTPPPAPKTPVVPSAPPPAPMPDPQPVAAAPVPPPPRAAPVPQPAVLAPVPPTPPQPVQAPVAAAPSQPAQPPVPPTPPQPVQPPVADTPAQTVQALSSLTIKVIVNVNGQERVVEIPAAAVVPKEKGKEDPSVPPPAPSSGTSAKIVPKMPDSKNGRVYRVQVGAFASTAFAQSYFDRLKAAGFSPAFERHGELYRVVVAGVKAADMAQVAQRLGAAGFKEAWVREE